MDRVIVAGAGLAGSEAAWQLAKRGIPVTLIEGKPEYYSPAHTSPLFAELVCSNSLRANALTNAVGLLKEELRQLGSLVMEAADHAAIPAGGALAVDREAFSGEITRRLEKHPLVRVERRYLEELPPPPCVIATGPLTEGKLAEKISGMAEGRLLHFRDAVAPIVTAESVNMEIAFRASRSGGRGDYINCPLTKEEYYAFVRELVAARCAPLRSFEEAPKIFEGCMPVEVMAARGPLTLAYGPLKPVGLINPRTNRQPFAAVQLRQDDGAATLYNMVGFQTRLTFPEQKRVFSMIPGLENAVFSRYGVMHRNTYLESPGFLDTEYQCICRPMMYFAGQMTGVEGYVESVSSGFTAGVSLARQLLGKKPVDLTDCTIIGALARYISNPAQKELVPMNASFGLMAPFGKPIKGSLRREAWVARSMLVIDTIRDMILEDIKWSN